MAAIQDLLADKLAETLDSAARCADAATSENYDRLEFGLHELEELAARVCGSHQNWRPLVAKLRGGAALTPEEIASLRALVVGDAEAFLKYDQEHDRATAELDQLIDRIRQIEAAELTPESVMQLRVLCQDAHGPLAAAAHYLDGKERIQRFDAATQGNIDRDAAHLLAGMIEDMLR